VPGADEQPVQAPQPVQRRLDDGAPPAQRGTIE
jgi:hypothetical protein